MVALGTWGLAHTQGADALRVRAEQLRDGGPAVVAQFMEELREEHLGLPLAEPDRVRVTDQLDAAVLATSEGSGDAPQPEVVER
jgi:hypothetical protein